MRLFQNEVLSQALRLRASSVELPLWLKEARDALRAPREGDVQTARLALASELAGIKGWPASVQQLNDTLDELARPVAQFLSRAFCKVGIDAYGAPIASVWGSSAKLIARDGSVSIAPTAEGQALSQLSLAQAFERSGWLDPSPLAAAPESAPKPQAAPAPRRELAESLRGEPDDFLSDLAADQNREPGEMSPSALRLRDRVNLMFAERDPELSGAQTLLMSDGELIERSDFLAHGSQGEARDPSVKIKAAGAPTAPAAGHERDYSAELGRGLIGLIGLPERASEREWGEFRKAAALRASLEPSAAREGFERGEALLRALDNCGPRALASARLSARERLAAFIDQSAPGLRDAARGADVSDLPLGELLEPNGFKARLAAARSELAPAGPRSTPSAPKAPK